MNHSDNGNINPLCSIGDGDDGDRDIGRLGG